MTLLVDGLVKRYGGLLALDGAQLRAEPGRIHALLGENGAGKSTLIRILSGVVRADAGTVALGDEPLALGSPRASARAGIRTAFQELSLIPHASVAENLLFGAQPTLAGRVRRRRMRRDAAALLSSLGLGHISPAAPIDVLALGERQLLEVTKALRDRPRLLILDEATSALSGDESAWVLRQARAAADAGSIVLFITHRLAEVREHADDVTVLRGGRTVVTGRAAELDDGALVAAMLGRRIDRVYPERHAKPGDVLLEARGVEVGHRVGPLDLAVRHGEILGIGALQGQGQRELLMALAGAVRHRGTMTLDGRPYTPHSPREALAVGVALVPEDRQSEGLFLSKPVRENVTVSTLDRFVDALRLLRPGREQRAAREAAGRVGLAGGRLEDAASALSGGNQQKAILARVLLAEPRLLLLFDCTRGVDVGTKAEIFQLTVDLAAQGVGIVLYSSDLSELVHLCDRVAVMAEGRVRGVLEAPAIAEDAILRLAVGGGVVDSPAPRAGAVA